MNACLRFGPLALVLAASAASVAHATPTVFFGENQTPSNTVTGAPATARTSFLSYLASGVTSQGFESFTLNDLGPLTLTFVGSASPITATLSGDGQVTNNVSAGRFNTTPAGSKWWDVSGDFTIDFSSPISAFGFYGTDVGDFNGQITIDLIDTLNRVTHSVLNNSINGKNGALLFYGFIDGTNSYKQITFGNTAAGTDFFGFDDMVIGNLAQVLPPTGGSTPEPTSLALTGLALAAAGFAAGRKRRA